MDSRIDLDAAATLIGERRAAWRAAGITSAELTWGGWQRPLTTDRGQLEDPDSVGVNLRKGEQEGSVVLFKGGWVDLQYWDGRTDPVIDAPGWEDWLDLDRFADVLSRLSALFR